MKCHKKLYHTAKQFLTKQILSLPQLLLFVYRELTLRTSNRHADTIISNAMFRLTVERMKKDLSPNAFIIQDKKITKALEKSAISRASNGLFLGCNSIITKR